MLGRQMISLSLKQCFIYSKFVSYNIYYNHQLQDQSHFLLDVHHVTVTMAVEPQCEHYLHHDLIPEKTNYSIKNCCILCFISLNNNRSFTMKISLTSTHC